MKPSEKWNGLFVLSMGAALFFAVTDFIVIEGPLWIWSISLWLASNAAAVVFLVLREIADRRESIR